MGIIYILRNKINNKKYIGQTINSFDIRLKKHFHDKPLYPIQRALRKYSIDNFNITIIECENNNLDRMEKYLIKYHNTKIPFGYNMTDGGDGTRGRISSKESIERYKKANKGKNNPMYGRKNKHTKEWIYKIKESNFRNLYTFINIKSNKTYKTSDIKLFCKKFSLKRQSIFEAIKHNRLLYGSWNCYKELLNKAKETN